MLRLSSTAVVVPDTASDADAPSLSLVPPPQAEHITANAASAAHSITRRLRRQPCPELGTTDGDSNDEDLCIHTILDEGQ